MRIGTIIQNRMQLSHILLIIVGAAVLSSAYSTEESFKQWMSLHNKNYLNDAEYMYRLSVYRDNLEFIEEHNRQNKGFTVAINQFGDMTASEFGDLYNNYLMPVNKTISKDVHVADPLREMAATVDWRTKGVVTAVKNQGQCGSCWAFSTTGSTEGQHALATGKLVSLSEQQLVDCSDSYGNNGCNGGLMDNAFRYIIANKGIDTEASYPYTARAEWFCYFKKENVAATLSSYKDVQSGSESALQSAVESIGPISVAIDASHSSFQFYSSGVYYESACSSTQLDHGVLAVGYGTLDSSDYWIVKNSWGASWGQNGYILMARNRNNNCGIATAASYPKV
eukprot:TRINITY_DN30_c1_g1_i4.p1 TRINITY_DN30_c1_g1~~TRINITY_DN30_c1_g1_i4.p1  ORF type:complete len:338 (-),score=98.90 TRINITY_DN30_c1_g1_i4:46-1059(-)